MSETGNTPPGISSVVEVGTVAAQNPIGWGTRLGIWAWSFVGVVAALTIVVLAVGAVSEIVLPLTFAAVLAVCFMPCARWVQRHGLAPPPPPRVSSSWGCLRSPRW